MRAIYNNLFGGGTTSAAANDTSQQQQSQMQYPTMAQATRLFGQVKDKASTFTADFAKKMPYAGDILYFETGDERDDDMIRQ